MALAARAPAQGEGDALRVAPPFDASARARLERRHVDSFRVQDGFRLVPELRGQALDEQGRAVLGQRVASRRRRGADAPQGPEVVRLQRVARGRGERAADPRLPRWLRRFSPSAASRSSRTVSTSRESSCAWTSKTRVLASATRNCTRAAQSTGKKGHYQWEGMDYTTSAAKGNKK